MTRWLQWLLVAFGLGCLGIWFVPASAYSVSPTHEEARFTLGWPTPWYGSTIRIDAGSIVQLPDFVEKSRPWKAKGPDRIWTTPVGSLERMPRNLPGIIGWRSAECRLVRRAKLIYGPLVPTVIGFGCFYIAWQLRPRTKRPKPEPTNADPLRDTDGTNNTESRGDPAVMDERDR